MGRYSWIELVDLSSGYWCPNTHNDILWTDHQKYLIYQFVNGTCRLRLHSDGHLIRDARLSLLLSPFIREFWTRALLPLENRLCFSIRNSDSVHITHFSCTEFINLVVAYLEIIRFIKNLIPCSWVLFFWEGISRAASEQSYFQILPFLKKSCSLRKQKV